MNTVRPVVNGRLVPSIHRYQDFKVELGIISVVRQNSCRAVRIVASMVVVLFLAVMILVTVGVQLIRRSKLL